MARAARRAGGTMMARATAEPRTAELLRMRRGELMDTMRAGHPIDAGALDDLAYHGISLGLPRWVERAAPTGHAAGALGLLWLAALALDRRRRWR